jgi:hypothetical protein
MEVQKEERLSTKAQRSSYRIGCTTRHLSTHFKMLTAFHYRGYIRSGKDRGMWGLLNKYIVTPTQ